MQHDHNHHQVCRACGLPLRGPVAHGMHIDCLPAGAVAMRHATRRTVRELRAPSVRVELQLAAAA